MPDQVRHDIKAECEMKLARILFLSVAGIFMITISGCKKDSLTNPFDNINITENTPTFSNSANSFAFSINATEFTKIYEYIISMSSQTLGIALTVTNRTRGSVTVLLYDDKNNKVLTRDLSTNVASSETLNFEANVNRIQIQFTNFTATFNCAITAK